MAQSECSMHQWPDRAMNRPIGNWQSSMDRSRDRLTGPQHPEREGDGGQLAPALELNPRLVAAALREERVEHDVRAAAALDVRALERLLGVRVDVLGQLLVHDQR